MKGTPMLVSKPTGYALQPVICVTTGRLIYNEMLSRFPDGVNVQDAICAAEGQGLIHVVDLQVLNWALARLRSDTTCGTIAVNISPYTIEQHGETVLETIAAASTYRLRLVLEITETAPIMDLERFSQFIDRASSLGVRFAVDDVGTGFCDTSRVVLVKASFIKLPKGGAHGWSQLLPAYHRAIADLARRLESLIIAEGIECAADLSTIKGLEIAGMQGFYLSTLPAPSVPLEC